MATLDNPYGVACLSSCFWPWTFKTGGWRYFVKYCERHGLPWPIGRYPLGTNDDEQAKLAQALATMIESAYAVVPEGTGIELLEAKSSGGTVLPQEKLIDKANGEMSKALTGQNMVAELHGVGARSASETALKRQLSIDDSVRDIASGSINQIFKWITLFNFGDGIAPPQIEFYQHENAGKERAETYMLVAQMGARPSRSAMLQELGIPEAESDEDTVMIPQAVAAPALQQAAAQARADPSADPGQVGPGEFARFALEDLEGVAGFAFARAAGMTDEEAITLATEAADAAIEDHMIAPVARMLGRFEADGKTLAEFSAALQDIVGAMDDQALREVVERSLSFAILAGATVKTG